jgi:hypothetical protein
MKYCSHHVITHHHHSLSSSNHHLLPFPSSSSTEQRREEAAEQTNKKHQSFLIDDQHAIIFHAHWTNKFPSSRSSLPSCSSVVADPNIYELIFYYLNNIRSRYNHNRIIIVSPNVIIYYCSRPKRSSHH